jgi:hypothetical protein
VQLPLTTEFDDPVQLYFIQASSEGCNENGKVNFRAISGVDLGTPSRCPKKASEDMRA